MSETIPLSEPWLTGNARSYLDECIETNFVSSVGPFVERFEHEFAAYVGARHAVACASGTAALHVALKLAGVHDGDEVWVPTLTFIASANPVAYERAVPVLVDSEPDTWNVDCSLMIEELYRRARTGAVQPRAIEIVHLLGHPVLLDALHDACEKYGVALIEDAAESVGARWTGGRFAGRHTGTVGRIGCFSFNGNKIITTGGGGMIVTDDEKLARRARHLTTQARLPGLEYRHDETGYNYRLTNIAAALGVAQLEQLPDFVERKRAMAARYDASLGARNGIVLPPRASWAAATTWLYTVLVHAPRFGFDRRVLHERLGRAGVQSRPIWSPLHTMSMYIGAPRLGDGAVAERIFDEALSLPSSVHLAPAQQARVIDVIQSQ
jgi:dTDP-4-amino-4,6-dideoxygalactose transaminase